MRKPREENLKPRGFKLVPIEARPLVTIGPEERWWESCRRLPEDLLAPQFREGTIVRLRPPADLTEAQLEAVKRAMLRGGAAAVKVEWPNRPATVPPQRFAPVLGPHDGIRAVVMRMVGEANTRDIAALKVAVEAALAAAGL